MGKTIKVIATHIGPHLDEVVAIWLLQRFGESQFPGITSAKLEFWNAGPETPDGKPASAYEDRGYLLIGVGGSRFDEHPSRNEERKAGDCATSLVAKELGLTEEKSLAGLLKFTTSNDLRGGSGPFELPALIARMHRAYPKDSQKVLEWAFLALDALIAEQQKFHGEAAAEYTKAVIEEIPGPFGMLRLVSIESDCDQLGAYSRSRAVNGQQADLFIQKRSSGHVVILKNKHQMRVKLDDVIAVLRMKEQAARGMFSSTSFTELRAENSIPCAPEWYYQKDAQNILNGSHSAPTVPATRLTLAEVVSVVKFALDPHAFEPSRETTCRNGTCTHQERRCDLYELGLSRCRTIRFKSKQ